MVARRARTVNTPDMARAGWLSTNDVLVLGAVAVVGVDAVEFVIRMIRAIGMGRKTTRTLFACDIAAKSHRLLRDGSDVT